MKLNEVFSPLSDAQFEPGLKKYETLIRDYFNRSQWLHRGIRSKADYILHDKGDHVRPSSQTKSFVNTLIANLPEWEGYPDRSQSIFASEDSDVAAEYGTVYFVIPIGNPTVASTSSKDFWDAFDIGQVNTLCDMLDNLFYEINEPVDDLDFSSIVTALKAVDKARAEGIQFEIEDYSTLDTKGIDYEINHTDTPMLDMLSDWLAPTSCFYDSWNNITLPSSSEIWFSGPALLINRQYAKNQGFF